MDISDVPAYVVDEFWGRIDKTGECWPWNGPQDGKGYGRLVWRSDGQLVRMLTHRLAYLLTYGFLPERPLILRHSICGNPICCNPNHLSPGTYQDNADDRGRMGRNTLGDANGTHKHPERLPRGDRHPSRLYPEKRPRGDEHWTRKRVGEYHGARSLAKLNDDSVRSIRQEYAAGGVSQKALADRYHVTEPTVSALIRMKTWKHVI